MPHTQDQEDETQDGGTHQKHHTFGEHISVSQVKSGAVLNFVVTVFARGGVQIIQLSALLVLARLLTPEDFGIIAMVASTFGVADLLRDLGLSQATVQLPTLTRSQVNTLFWINVAFGLLMTAVAFASSPYLADFFSDPKAGAVAAVLSLKILINSLGAQHLALLRRKLRFPVIARIMVLSALVANGTAIVLAFMGASYWSLVASALIMSALMTSGAWLRSGWRPGLPSYDPSVRPMLSFGGYLVGFGVLSYAAQNLQNIIIGRSWGAAQAGLYSRAAALLNMPMGYLMEPLSTIAPATLSRLGDEAQSYRGYYLNMLSFLALIFAPLTLWLAFMAPEVVRLVLGPRWDDAGVLLRWLALGMLPMILCKSTGWLYLSRGDSKRMMQWGMMGWSVVIFCMFIGLRWGAQGVATMYAVSMYIIVIPCLLYACKGTEITIGLIYSRIQRQIYASFACAAVLFLLFEQIQQLQLIFRLATSAALFGLVYVMLLLTVFNMRGELLRLIEKGRSLFTGKALA